MPKLRRLILRQAVETKAVKCMIAGSPMLEEIEWAGDTFPLSFLSNIPLPHLRALTMHCRLTRWSQTLREIPDARAIQDLTNHFPELRCLSLTTPRNRESLITEQALLALQRPACQLRSLAICLHMSMTSGTEETTAHEPSADLTHLKLHNLRVAKELSVAEVADRLIRWCPRVERLEIVEVFHGKFNAKQLVDAFHVAQAQAAAHAT